MADTFPLKELRLLLEKAQAADADLKQFGAKNHKYQWNPPASLTDIGDSVFYSSSGGDSMEITIHEPTMTAWLEALPLRSGSSTAAS